MSKIQSILFDRKYFTKTSARIWLLTHGYIATKVDVTSNYLRYRQIDPSPYKRYRIINFNSYVKAVIEI